jgi:hypothetical protein
MFFMIIFQSINPILHTAWLDNDALTLKSNSAKYYHTYVKNQRENMYGRGTITCETTIPKPRV